MGKVIADTDVFIEIFNKNESLFTFISENIFFENLLTTVVTEAELVISATNKQTQLQIENFLTDVIKMPISVPASILCTTLIKKYHLSHNLKIADCLIAAICINADLPLFTLNTKDFKYIPNLKLISHNIKPVKRKLF